MEKREVGEGGEGIRKGLSTKNKEKKKNIPLPECGFTPSRVQHDDLIRAILSRPLGKKPSVGMD